MKTYKRRDSATSILRKMGINSRDYNLFITKVDGGFELYEELAKKHLKNLEVQTKPKKKASEPKKVVEPTGPRVTAYSVAAQMILDGKSNQEIWEVIQPQFNLEQRHRHYPSWYRCYMRRMGKISQDTRKRQQKVHVIYE